MRLLNSTEVFALTYRRASSSLDFKVKQIHYELPDFGLYFCRLMRAIDVFAASQGIARSVAAITEGNISQPILNFGPPGGAHVREGLEVRHTPWKNR